VRSAQPPLHAALRRSVTAIGLLCFTQCDPQMRDSVIDVLYVDNHLLALNKPAGLPTMGVTRDRASLIEAAKQYIKHRYHKPGNVYLGVVSRLDAPVTGVVLMARTSKAAARLTAQFRTQQVRKTYWALVAGKFAPASGTWTDWLAEDPRHRRMHVVGASYEGAKQARLAFRTLASFPWGSLLEIDLLTGRKHQIRVQFASRGHAILGDQKYGAATRFDHGIALHSRRLRLTHPVRGDELELTAPVDQRWKSLGIVD
jgi:23S rRNA pseudouridine1911/1915/1917 synthase